MGLGAGIPALALDIMDAHEPASGCLPLISNGGLPSSDALLEFLSECVSAAQLEEWWHRVVKCDLGRETASAKEACPWPLEDARLAGHVDGACP